MGLGIVLASITSYILPNVTNNEAVAQDLPPMLSVHQHAVAIPPTEQVHDRCFLCCICQNLGIRESFASVESYRAV